MAYIKSRKHAVARAVPQLTGAAAATLIAFSAPVMAQTSLREVKVESAVENYKAESVSSPKATAPLLNTPQTVQVIKEQIIREQGATTLTEALRNSPGVGTFNLGENGTTNTGDAIYIRGTDASSNIFVDGVRDLGSISRDVFNIDQIEVLKGSAGADIGRGSATGAINLSTKHPQLEDAFSGSVGLGSAKYKRATADLNKKIDDTSAFRLNLLDQDAGVAGRDFIKNKRWGVAGSLAFGLGTPTRVTVDYLHVKQDNVPDGGVFTIGLPGYSTPQASRSFLNSAARVNSKNFYGTTDDHDKVTADMFTVILEHDFTSNVTLRNTTRWGKTDQEYQLSSFMGATAQLVTPNPGNPATWTITRNINNKNVSNEILTNQTNLTAKFDTAGLSHTAVAGVEFIREQQTNLTYVGTGAYPAVSVYNPNAYVSGYTRSLSGAYTDGKTSTVGLYAIDTVKLNEAWQLTGGVRYDRYDTDYKSVLATGATTPYSADDHVISGKLGIVYKPAPNGSVYASWAVTKQPPGGANFTLAASNTANVNNPDVDPQSAKTAEVGTKWDLLDNRLSLTAALYRTNYSEQVLQDTDGTYYRAGKKTVKGIELGAVGAITPDWNLSAGFTTMDTKVESPTNQVVTADGSTDLAYTPTSAFTLWSTYRLPFGVTIGGGPRYNGKMKRGSDGAIGTPSFVESYWVFDALASYRINKNVEIQLNIFNLFDKDYVAAINKSGYRYTPGIERSARLTANFTF
ncbi:MAG: catecholate siderophore receptor Fiu [Pseudomonadota bacterium]